MKEHDPIRRPAPSASKRSESTRRAASAPSRASRRDARTSQRDARARGAISRRQLIFGFLAILVGLTVWRVARISEPVKLEGWRHVESVADPRERASVVLFTADWCAPCQQLKRSTLSDPAIVERLRSEFDLLLVDLTSPTRKAEQTAASHGVRGIPTMIVFDASGEPVSRLSGAVGPEAFHRFLDDAERKMSGAKEVSLLNGKGVSAAGSPG